MDRGVLEKLRRDQALRTLPDGREGVDVTVQYVGQVPPVSRAERKNWLQERFAKACQRLGPSVEIKPESLSVSGQTVEAVVPVSKLEEVRERLSPEQFRIDVTTTRQVVDRS